MKKQNLPPSFLLFFAALVLPLFPALAEESQTGSQKFPSNLSLPICHGYHLYPQGGIWGVPLNNICAPGEAVSGLIMIGISSSAPGSAVPLSPNCCPLPAADILTDEHVMAESQCPENHVATGTRVLCPGIDRRGQKLSSNCVRPLRCTKINTDRYQLAASKPAAFWGYGSTQWKHPLRYMRAEIPAGIRYGLGRMSKYQWVFKGCVGSPFGSLLAKKVSKRCKGLYFRQLQYRGAAGDPPAGTPVKMFADCRDISDQFSPNPECLQ